MSLGSGFVSYCAHKQSDPINSTAEEEYVVAIEETKEII